MSIADGNLKILGLTSHDLGGREYGSMIRAQNIFRALKRLGRVRVVLAGARETRPDGSGDSLGEFELAAVMPFHPAGISRPADFLRYESSARFLNTHKLAVSDQDRRRLEQLIAEHDLVWIHTLRVANSFGIHQWPRSVLDVDDVPSAFWHTAAAREINPARKCRYYWRAWRWRRREKILPERFDALGVCSEPDRQYLGGSDRIFVIPNGFTRPEQSPRRDPATPPRIGFLGTFRYLPNVTGIRWFLKSVWPAILRQAPEARLRLAGPGSEDFRMPGRNVDRLGWIPDIAGEMATWSLAIVPLFVGGGTRIKIADAFSRQCPVVSTSLGAYGYEVSDDRELFLADAPGEFAAKCLRILMHPEEGRRLSENAWQKFLAHWTWEKIGEQVVKAAETVLQKSRA